MKRPKRNFERCKHCARLQKIDLDCLYLQKHACYFCRKEEDDGKYGFAPSPPYGKRILIYGDSYYKFGIEKKNWSKFVVPKDCRFYVEHFLDDCNETTKA